MPPTASASHRVTVIPGDGVGPEIVRSAMRIIDAAGVAIDLGGGGRRGGRVPGRRRDRACRARRVTRSSGRGSALKGPLETPVGFGEKSANVTLRKLFETYANVRPARELPGVPTRYAGEGIDMIIVRENIEDLYAGIEHLETPDVAQGLKLITPQGLGEDHPLRLRAGAARGPDQGHGGHQGQHHEAHRGPLQAGLRGAGGRVSGHHAPST